MDGCIHLILLDISSLQNQRGTRASPLGRAHAVKMSTSTHGTSTPYPLSAPSHPLPNDTNICVQCFLPEQIVVGYSGYSRRVSAKDTRKRRTGPSPSACSSIQRQWIIFRKGRRVNTNTSHPDHPNMIRCGKRELSPHDDGYVSSSYASDRRSVTCSTER